MKAVRHGETVALVLSTRSAAYLVKALDGVTEATQYIDLKEVTSGTAEALVETLEDYEFLMGSRGNA